MGDDPQQMAIRMREAERLKRIEEALGRERAIRAPTPVHTTLTDAPAERVALGEAVASGVSDDGTPCFYLEGCLLEPGAVIEVYTNAAASGDQS